ncbi:MAG: inclusion body protein [Acidobacteriota bacterium]|jgi:hypothetical protein|nr:inclusion body protein [Acidobacteriota bacterium]
MANNINVLIVIDTEATQAGPTTVYMVDDNPRDQQGQGGNELTINASVNDMIFWRVTGIIPETNPELTQFVFTSGGNIFQGAPSVVNGVWQAQVAPVPPGTPQAVYHFNFTINGRGSYNWDPFINVT